MSLTGKENKKNQVLWINCTKAVAILAVLLDHSAWFQDTSSFGVVTFFSVPLFILLSGMTSFMTGQKYRQLSLIKCFWKKSKGILTAYLLATFICLIVSTQFFDFATFWTNLIHFTGSPPFYYVCLYLQLMLIFQPLYRIVAWIPRNPKGYFAEFLLGAFICGLSVLTTNYTNVLDVMGGGGKLFGGTFLLLFYIGMISAKHNWFFHTSIRKELLCGVLFGVAAIAFGKYLCMRQLSLDIFFPFGQGKNPPGISLMVFSILILCFCYSIFSLMERNRVGVIVAKGVGWFGQHTMYIFLYHWLFMMQLINHGVVFSTNSNLNAIFYFSIMIGGSLLTELIVCGIKRLYKNIINVEVKTT